MGRSVSYPSGAIVAFRTLEIEHDDDWDWECECLVEEVIETARSMFPSLERCDGWRGHEDRILLRNAFADCGISTYCGLVAIWLAERDDSRYWEADAYRSRSGRLQRWLSQVASRFEAIFGDLCMIGRFSNGEVIFERISVQMIR
ncbi:MAG: hypothetical protein COW16_05405 [Sphingomonadales bacterium CG12_big_fil_rev_8_21_14_0_65_65_10]|nr:MAG: hypothetical protein COW16_05405 [Sphingomonadales bacterium CG12_big_fil_rev_8_21_14_0_65_65_10]